jgi:hypothetical protein
MGGVKGMREGNKGVFLAEAAFHNLCHSKKPDILNLV